MAEPELPDEARNQTIAAWNRYLDGVMPLRPDLFRYCRRLTGDLWDAEDLIQDTLLRGFATLGSVHHSIRNPRAYLLRVATNLWIDSVRRRGHHDSYVAEQTSEATRAPSAPSPAEAIEMRDAATVLMQRLSPQERACVVLKDVFDMNLEETAGVLGTTIGAVKAALHRGRTRLREPAGSDTARRPLPSAALVDQFVDRYNARDLPGLLSLMLDTGSIELYGLVVETGRDAFERKDGWFDHNFAWPKEMGHSAPRWERTLFQGEPLALVFSTHGGREALSSVMRFEEEDGRVARIRVYGMCPETVAEVGASLGLQVHALPRVRPRTSAASRAAP